MKNYLFYPDCFTAEDINRCRFALLKFLGLYNLTPPTNIGVIIHTNKDAAFEIFPSFFSEVQIKHVASSSWNDLPSLQKLAAPYEGNLIICRTNGYMQQPVDDLFKKINEGRLFYCLQQSDERKEALSEFCFDKTFAIGVNTTTLKNASANFSTSARDSNMYFTTYKNRKEINALLKLFFERNEEESATNLVKRAKSIDLAALEKEANATDKLPFIKKWFRKLTRKNNLLQRYQNKL